MTRKGDLQKVMDKHFGGKWWLAGNEMVVSFCDKYDISGSLASYDLYTAIRHALEGELKKEKAYYAKWAEYEKETKKLGY